MDDYLDNDNKKLEKGFYRYHNHGLIYFTGEYSNNTLPVFEKENAIGNKEESKTEFNHYIVRRLVKISKKEIREQIKSLRKKTNWLEERLEK